MHSKLVRLVAPLGLAFAAVLVANCGGGSSTSSTPATTPTATPTPTAGPTGGNGASPTPTPSSAPTPNWTLNGATASKTFTAGTAPTAFALAAYSGITVSAQFATPTSGTATLVASDALNNGSDVVPNTLPADTATVGNTPIIYVSFYNGGTSTVSFGTSIPSVTVSGTALTGKSVCELDVYGSQGSGNTKAWFTPSTATGTVSGTSVTVPPGTLTGAGNTVDFNPGQQIVAVSCH